METQVTRQVGPGSGGHVTRADRTAAAVGIRAAQNRLGPCDGAPTTVSGRKTSTSSVSTPARFQSEHRFFGDAMVVNVIGAAAHALPHNFCLRCRPALNMRVSASDLLGRVDSGSPPAADAENAGR